VLGLGVGGEEGHGRGRALTCVLVGLSRSVGPRLVGTSVRLCDRLLPNKVVEAPRGEAAAALTWTEGVRSTETTVREDTVMVLATSVAPLPLALPNRAINLSNLAHLFFLSFPPIFFQSEHVPLIKSYSTTRDRTQPPPVRRLGFQSHRRSSAPAAAALRCATCRLRGRRRLSSSACCTLRMPPGWPHPRFCAYRTLPSRPQP